MLSYAKEGVFSVKSEQNRSGATARARGAASRREKKIRKKPKNGIIAILAVAAAVVCVCVFGLISACSFSGGADVCGNGVTVAGYDCSGKTRDEVLAYLSTIDDPYAQLELTLSVDDGSATEVMTAEDIELKFDAAKTADAAFTFGKGSIFDMLSAQMGSKEVGYSYSYDQLKLEKLLNSFAKSAGGTLVQHEIEIGESAVVVHAGKDGLGVDVKSLRSRVLDSLAGMTSPEQTITVSKVNTSPSQISAQELYELTKRDAQDAKYAVKDGTVVVEAEIDGREIDINTANELLNGFGTGSSDITIPFIMTEAQVKADSLSMSLFADELGKFSTKYMTSNVPRSTNVELAAKYINNKIILPGEEFSYNGTVGKRSAERGFKAASVYENNKMVDGLGGGICQTSSTLYGAVLYADLEVTERHEHSLEVSYAPLGMDATVAYGSLDFRFKNNTDAPLKISSSWGGGTVSVKILGTKADKNRRVDISTKTISSVPYGVTEIQDSTLPAGQRVVDAPGFKGYVVDTYKIIYENGNEVENKLLHRSKYTMVNRVVRVGTGNAAGSEAPAEATPTPDSSAAPKPSAEPTKEPSQSSAPSAVPSPAVMPDGL